MLERGIKLRKRELLGRKINSIVSLGIVFGLITLYRIF